jgi:hypothetical protein
MTDRYRVARLRKDGTRVAAGSKRRLEGAIVLADTLHALTDSDFVVIAPDGVEIHWTSPRIPTPLVERVAGPDRVTVFCLREEVAAVDRFNRYTADPYAPDPVPSEG